MLRCAQHCVERGKLRKVNKKYIKIGNISVKLIRVDEACISPCWQNEPTDNQNRTTSTCGKNPLKVGLVNKWRMARTNQTQWLCT